MTTSEAILAVIPARMGSSRFPGKPMASLLGVPMIEHVYRRVAMSPILACTAVATCDDEIADHVTSFGGRAVLTGSHHERASDRCAEALEVIEREDSRRYDIVVIVQGDEPLVHPDAIGEAVEPMLTDSSLLVTNLLGAITTDQEFEDRNCIKVVVDRRSDALYFSREPIPTRSKEVNMPMGKQICVMPFRRQFLLDYTRMEPTPLEVAESVDMLRILEHGLRIRMVPTRYASHAVDTESDRRQVEEILRTDRVHQRIFGTN